MEVSRRVKREINSPKIYEISKTIFHLFFRYHTNIIDNHINLTDTLFTTMSLYCKAQIQFKRDRSNYLFSIFYKTIRILSRVATKLYSAISLMKDGRASTIWFPDNNFRGFNQFLQNFDMLLNYMCFRSLLILVPFQFTVWGKT